MLFMLDKGAGERDEAETKDHSEQGAPQAVGYALVDEPETGGEHETARQGVRDTEPAAREALDEEEGQRPNACRDRCQQRQQKDLGHAGRLHEPLSYRLVRYCAAIRPARLVGQVRTTPSF